MVSYCCGGQGDGERQRGTTRMCTVSQSHAPDDGQNIARNMLS